MWLARFIGRLLDLLFPPPDTARLIRECTDIEFLALVSPRVNDRGVTTLLPYRHQLTRAAIIEAKFHRNPKALRLLGTVLRDYLDAVTEESAELSSKHFLLVPIPLSRERMRARGYNQIDEIVRAADIQINHVLVRTRDTAPQTSLSRKARLRNMEHVFKASAPVNPSVTYLLIDDVTTTGATLAAAADALHTAGARHVELLALAH